MPDVAREISLYTTLGKRQYYCILYLVHLLIYNTQKLSHAKAFYFFASIGLATAFIKWTLVLLLIATIIFIIVNALNPELGKKNNPREELREVEDAEKKKLEQDQAELARQASENFIAQLQKQEEYAKAERLRHRDAEFQEYPYNYEIGQHGNEALAIRYGIANHQEKEYFDEFNYSSKKRGKNRSIRDHTSLVPATHISLRKITPLGNDRFIVLLSNHGDRRAIAVIEQGTEYVKTFLPLDDDWFKKQAKLEETLKNNKSFTLKELACFHVQKVV